MTLAENMEFVEALGPDGFHESLGVWGAVRTPCRNRHRLDSARLQKRRPRLRVQRVPIVDEMGHVSEEALCRIEQVAGDLRHPSAVRIDSNPRDVHRARLQFDDEQDHDSDRAEHAQGLNGEEIASVKRLPMARDELLPGSLSVSLRRGLDSRIRENGCDRRTANLDTEPVQSVADFRVAPTEVLGSESDDERADVVSLARSTGLRRCAELSYFLAASCRNHFRSVSGRTIWQHALRSSGVRALPLSASRRRWSSVNAIRGLPVFARRISRRTRTSSWRYWTLRAIRSLIA